MTEKTEAKIGIDSEKGNFVGGLTLIIWSIILGILVGTDTTGTYQFMLIFVVLLPPLGSHLVITSAVNIMQAIRYGEQ
ncbi:MAG: hypothetical protein KAU48_06870 [Candidatus Thorarchaeota archaeon]|nr:hypothetical protein [Candidatus Thorarchaeota archaeon]